MNQPSSPQIDSFAQTARSLASPSSTRPESPHVPKRPSWPRSHSSNSQTPLWSRSNSTSNILTAISRRLNASVAPGRDPPWYISLIQTGLDTLQGLWRLFNQLNPLQKVILVGVLLALNVITVVALVYSERIYEWMAPRAEDFKNSPITAIILWTFTFLSAFPPMIGYSTCVTLAGFIYGMKGWFIASTANVIGSTTSFIVCRRYLSDWSQRLAAQDTRIAAFTLVVQHDGFPLLCAIRLCPLPYAMSNCALSTIRSIQVVPFALASAAATPKLLLHVFVGSRLALLAQNAGKDEGKAMDTGSKIINYLGIAASIAVGVATGWIIYRRTVARARQLEAEDRERNEDGGGAANARRKLRARTTSGFFPSGGSNGDTVIPLNGGLEHPDAFAVEAFQDDDGEEMGDQRAWAASAEERDEIDFLHRTYSDSSSRGKGRTQGNLARWPSGDAESRAGLIDDKRRD